MIISPSLLATLGFVILASATTWSEWNTFSDVDEHCVDLLNFTGTDEAPTKVDTAVCVAYNETAQVPPFCRVAGHIDKYIGFEIRLPATGANWTGVFTQQGCGGSCGVLQLDGLHPIFATPEKPFGEGTGDACLKRGYIAAMTDMGHDNVAINVTSLIDFTFAHNNRTAEINFGYRSTHLTTVMGKAMAAAYYGTNVQYSYFVGGSTGADYQGIVCGFPAISELGVAAIQTPWYALINRDETGEPILRAAHAESLAKAALQSCDHLDGLVDGLIDSADLCVIDFDLVKCNSSRVIVNSTACLDDKVLEVTKKFYVAPTDSKGNILISTATLPGSESYWDRQGWLGYQTANGSWGSTTYEHAVNMLNYLSFEHDPNPSWTSLENYDLDTILSQIAYMEQIYSAVDADLDIFRRLGGKLIISQGWPDVNVTPHFVLDYYRRVVGIFGQETADSFVKLFMSNGQNHVQGQGLGASSGQDPYTRIAEWVEDGIPPAWFNGTKYSTNGTFEFSRPAFPFPYYAMYDGVGDPKLQESFYPVKRLTLFGNPISS